MPWLGIVPGRPTDLKPTLHIATVMLAIPTHVVGSTGADAVDLDARKRFSSLSCNVIMTAVISKVLLYRHICVASVYVLGSWYLNTSYIYAQVLGTFVQTLCTKSVFPKIEVNVCTQVHQKWLLY